MPRTIGSNPNNWPGPGDCETWGSGVRSPEDDCDCENGCVRCDPELAAEARAEAIADSRADDLYEGPWN